MGPMRWPLYATPSESPEPSIGKPHPQPRAVPNQRQKFNLDWVGEWFPALARVALMPELRLYLWIYAGRH